jgi:hypothetical protein
MKTMELSIICSFGWKRHGLRANEICHWIQTYTSPLCRDSVRTHLQQELQTLLPGTKVGGYFVAASVNGSLSLPSAHQAEYGVRRVCLLLPTEVDFIVLKSMVDHVLSCLGFTHATLWAQTSPFWLFHWTGQLLCAPVAAMSFDVCPVRWGKHSVTSLHPK